jgi:hypothetical protein
MWGKRRKELLKICQPTNSQERRAVDKEEPMVGEVKEFVFDELTHEFTGEKILWTAESIAKWRKQRATKERKREVRYGCWGHPGKPEGKSQVGVFCF